MAGLRCFVAFFIPPLGVYLQEGLSKRHWLALLLTILGFVPGVLYAVYVIFQHESQPRPLPPLDRLRERASGNDASLEPRRAESREMSQGALS